MNILYVHQYAMKPDQAGFSRAYDYGAALAAYGNSVEVLAGAFDHFAGHDPHLDEYEKQVSEDVGPLKYTWIKLPAYRGNSRARMWNMLVFMWRVALYSPGPWKPAVVIGSSPTLFGAFGAWVLSRRLKSDFVLEVRDLWPDSLVELAEYSRRDFRVWILRWMERFLYRRASLVLSTLPMSRPHIEKVAGVKRPFLWLPNGVAQPPEVIPWPEEATPFTVMYCGTHGIVNQLDDLLDVALALREKGCDNIEIKLVGNGPEKPRLEQRAVRLGLKNVTFLRAVPKRSIREVMAGAHVYIALFKESPLYQHGISANKLFDYLASGRPLILASKAPIHPRSESCEACIRVAEHDTHAIVNEIIRLSRMPRERLVHLGESGIRFVNRHFLIEKHARELHERLASIRSSPDASG